MKTLGTFIPARTPTDRMTAYAGIMPPEVIHEFTEGLKRDPNIAWKGEMDLRRAYIKKGAVYVDDICLSDLDLFFWFYILPEDLQSYDLNLLKTLARQIPVIPDPFGVERGFNKFTSHSLLSNAGVATPEFCMFRSDMVHEMEHLIEAWGCLLLKPVLGSFGHGVTMIKTKQQLIDAVQYAASFSRDPIQIFCERFEPNDISKWISTTIINGELVYGYRKRPEKFVEGWKVYDAKRIGGAVDYADPSPVAELVLAAAKALKADIIGFDCIFSERLGKYLIVDENTIPGMYDECFERVGIRWAKSFLRLIQAYINKDLSLPSKKTATRPL